MSKFKKLRKQRRISVAELSRLSGISKRTLEKYENGEREINKARAIAVYNIAKALNCSIEDLLDLEDERKDMVVKMTKYELFKLNNEISWKNRYGILPGCSIDLNGSQDPEKIEEFQTKEEALEALKKYSTSVGEGSGFFSITEYYVSEIEYDDGDFLSEDILKYSKMNILFLFWEIFKIRVKKGWRKKLIYTITFNPALDYIIKIENFKPNQRPC